MQEPDYIAKIGDLWEAELHADALRLTDEALQFHPRSPKLHCMRGDLIQLSWRAPADYPMDEAKACYQQAITCDPNCAEAHQELGICLDIEGELTAAEKELQTALALGAGADCHSGIARVWAQQGKASAEIVAFLDACPCANAPIVRDIRQAIAGGDWGPIGATNPSGTPPGCP